MELHDEIKPITLDTIRDLLTCGTVALVAKESSKTHGDKVLKKIYETAGREIGEDLKDFIEETIKPEIREDSGTLIFRGAFISCITAYEAWVSDVLRAILRKYPQKLKKEKVDSSIIIDSTSHEECLEKLIDKELIDILYGGPKEVTKRLQEITSIDIKNIPELADIFEIKAVRDILLHNKGIVNGEYLRKSRDKARASEDDTIKIDLQILIDSMGILTSFVTKVSVALVKKYKNKK